jgi:hypothetical protein
MLRLLILCFIIPNLLHADVIYEKLNFTDVKGREVVSLKIVEGISSQDYEDFEAAINDINQNNYRVQFDSVILNSEGGSSYYSQKIGRLLRANHLSTWIWPHDSCASACVNILQAGVCKMAEGHVGIHRGMVENDIKLNDVKEFVENTRKDDEKYLKEMDASPQMIWSFFNVPNWTMNYLSIYEKYEYGLYFATENEMQYRLQIASHNQGRFKSDLLDLIADRREEIYPDGDWDNGYVYKFPTCSEQLFLEDNLSDHVGIDTEPKPEDIFEIYDPIQGYYDEDENMTSSDVIPFKPGYAYYYGFAVYAKGPEIEFKERVKTSGSTVWEDIESGESLDKDPNYVISEDKSTITVTRKVDNVGSVFNSWILTKEDPKGELIIDILFKDEVVHTFKYWLE